MDNEIAVYPQKEFDEDAEDRDINDKIRVSAATLSRPSLPPQLTACSPVVLSAQELIPFAVVGSDQEYQVNGRRLLGRKTKWGTIEGTDLGFLFL